MRGRNPERAVVLGSPYERAISRDPLSGRPHPASGPARAQSFVRGLFLSPSLPPNSPIFLLPLHQGSGFNTQSIMPEQRERRDESQGVRILLAVVWEHLSR